ncbi:hypothetical protein [Pseudomonas sp. CFBP 13719]|uniref:hypothetical protein n=1 Tax=Pseudomonas sp. CFBP 13719 TaxID=2775303 RepID=UPI00177B2ACC|nr:hypothetical protein [Pseudomonas sp. CFBP 13719]MBD8682800.1 hypothetical protein [Pseudomonas sp. CFBP 13719]
MRKQVAYQALQDDLEDLRSERLAIERLSGIDTDLTLSLEEINARFKEACVPYTCVLRFQ